MKTIYMRIAVLFCFISLLISCNNGSGNKLELKKAENGDVYYGGTFKINEEEYFKSLNPLNITEVTGHRIINQIYEGLVVFNQKDLSIEPSIAESWTVSEDGKVYTFKLRENVFFHDDECFPGGKGRKVTVQDFKYCLDRLCFYNPAENQGFWIFKDIVEGANEYNELTKNNPNASGEVSGVKVIDDYTLEIKLTQPFSIFLSRLALSFAQLYPKEAVEKYGSEMRVHCVGTGPYKIKRIVDNQLVFLEKNPNYWGKDAFGNQLPYLDYIKFTFIKEKKAELTAFTKGELDFLYRLPLEMKEEVVDIDDNLKPAYSNFQLQYMPSMTIQYYGLLHPGKIFNNKKTRQALCYAIDREKLVKYTVKGSGYAAVHGFVPPGTGSFPYEQVKGYTYQPEKAQQLLAEAGFPKGKGFPKLTLQINSGGGRNEQVAEAIQKMLQEVLNIEVELLTVPWPQHTEAIESAKADFWRLGWIADYPEAENFLNLFHSKWVPDDINVKTYINSFRYKSKTFDEYFDKALAATDETERNQWYVKADQTAVDDAVAIPLFYDKDYRLLQPNVRNFPQNGMEYRNLRDVYFVP